MGLENKYHIGEILSWFMLIIVLFSNMMMVYLDNVNLPINIFIALFISLFVYTLFIVKTLKFERFSLAIALVIAITSLIDSFAWTMYKNIIICVGPITAIFLIIYISKEKLRKFTVGLLLLNLVIAIYEYVSNTYLYDFTTQAYGNEVTITAYEELMRSKGIFATCLGLGYYALFTSFIFKKDLLILTLGILLTLLASARQPLIVIFVLMAITFYKNTNFKNFLFIIFCIILIFVLSNFLLQTQNIERIFATADFNNDTSNNDRIMFWLLGINTYVNEYDFLHKLVGNMGYFQSKIGYNAESAWITLLLDTGLVGFFLHLIVFIKLFFLAKSDLALLFQTISLLIMMGTIALIFNLSQNIFYWIFIFDTLRSNKFLKINNNEKSILEQENDALIQC